MKQFFPMRRGEAPVLPFLITFAVISFLPIWLTIELGGIAVFGWLMATLMLASPILTLLVIRRSDKTFSKQSSSETMETPEESDPKKIERKQKSEE